MIKKEVLYGFGDVTLIPYPITDIESRSTISDINSLLHVSPMDTVSGTVESLEEYAKRGLVTYTVRGMWKQPKFLKYINTPHTISFTLNEFNSFLNNVNSDEFHFISEYKKKFKSAFILVDVANGHMKKLLELSKQCKKRFGNTVHLTVGNIAHPSTYVNYAKFGVDAIRLSIGTGSACLTSAKTAIHYPAISLINACYEYKKKFGVNTDIIMDGGIKDASYIIKAFAAGADGVMMGSMFNKCVESSGQKYMTSQQLVNKKKMISNHDATLFYKDQNIEVEYRGMSTNKVQQKELGSHKNYEEGLEKRQVVEYTLDKLLHELNYSIKSAFSYCDALNLDEFKESAVLYLVQNNHHNKL